MSKKGLMLTVLLCTFAFTGCGSQELENRSFPLAVGYEKQKEECRLVFNFPDLSAVANENADGIYTTVLAKDGDDFFSIQKNYEKNSSKTIDFSHTKALILSEEILQDEKELQDFIDYTKNQELMARNTYLFVTELPMEELFSLDENLEKSFGTYLEEILESDEDYKNKQIMTLGKLYDERSNRQETLFIPVLGEQNQAPAIIYSYVLKGGEALKKVPVETAMNGMFIQGKLYGMDFKDEKGREWRISRINPRYRFEGEVENPSLKIEISCQAVLENNRISDWREEEQIENSLAVELSRHFTQAAENGLQEGFDITNSYKKLGKYYRKAYRYYRERGGYEKALQIEVEVRPSIVNAK